MVKINGHTEMTQHILRGCKTISQPMLLLIQGKQLPALAKEYTLSKLPPSLSNLPPSLSKLPPSLSKLPPSLSKLPPSLAYEL